MCFSANASFAAGIILSAIGVAAIRKVQHKSQIPFAVIPLIFAVQQITEGFLWLSLPDPLKSTTSHALTIIFLLFAQVVWPLYVPLSILLLEKKGTRKNIQKILAGLGALVSLYLGYCLFNYPVQAQITGHHVEYIRNYLPTLQNPVAVCYIISIITPSFFSHIKRMWMLGVTIIISAAITELFYENYFVSVWCFFASLLSLAVYMVMIEIQEPETKIQNPLVNYTTP